MSALEVERLPPLSVLVDQGMCKLVVSVFVNVHRQKIAHFSGGCLTIFIARQWCLVKVIL